MANTKFAGDFVIENLKITQLSAQKKKSGGSTEDSIVVEQVPFSLSGGPGHRSRAIPYFCTIGIADFYFTEKKIHSVVD